jgi:predicted nuclease of predicted toxin-antitoxin system
MALRFHLDENVHGAVADALRRRGIDVTTSFDADLVGASDEQHLAYALVNGRVVVTHDPDFLRLHASGASHAGIAFCHSHRRSLRELIAATVLLSMKESPEAMVNRVEYL